MKQLKTEQRPLVEFFRDRKMGLLPATAGIKINGWVVLHLVPHSTRNRACARLVAKTLQKANLEDIRKIIRAAQRDMLRR